MGAQSACWWVPSFACWWAGGCPVCMLVVTSSFLFFFFSLSDCSQCFFPRNKHPLQPPPSDGKCFPSFPVLSQGTAPAGGRFRLVLMSSSLLPNSRSAGREVWLGTARAACQGRFSWRAAGGIACPIQWDSRALQMVWDCSSKRDSLREDILGIASGPHQPQHGRESLEEPEALTCVNTHRYVVLPILQQPHTQVLVCSLKRANSWSIAERGSGVECRASASV